MINKFKHRGVTGIKNMIIQVEDLIHLKIQYVFCKQTVVEEMKRKPRFKIEEMVKKNSREKKSIITIPKAFS